MLLGGGGVTLNRGRGDISVMKILKEVERRFGDGVPTLQVPKH